MLLSQTSWWRDSTSSARGGGSPNVKVVRVLVGNFHCNPKKYLVIYFVHHILTRKLLVPRIKNHLSSFELGLLNIFSRQNLLRSLSLILFLLQRYKYGAKKCPKNHVRFDCSQSENRKNNRKTFEGASVEPTIKIPKFQPLKILCLQLTSGTQKQSKITKNKVRKCLRASQN